MLKQFKSQFFAHPLTQLENVRQSIKIKDDWPESLRQLLSYSLPNLDTNIDSLYYLALDFETTGFNPIENTILSIGTVPLFNSKIELAGARHFYLSGEGKVKPESAVINHITPEMLLEGDNVDQAMNKLFDMMKGKVLIVHGTVIEKSFVDYYVSQKFGIDQLPVVWVDTLLIEKKLTYINHGETCMYQLTDVRAKHHLPNYPAHNALVDSVACAELFLAQLVNIFGQERHTISLKAVYNSKTCPRSNKLFS